MVNTLPNGKLSLKIIDFGLSIATKDIKMETNSCGTAGYIAPEMFAETFNYKADVFSAGATLFKMLTKRSLFKGLPHS
jgi:serine/threonine protein kinase